jgi:aminoglycoside phosphotransferase
MHSFAVAARQAADARLSPDKIVQMLAPALQAFHSVNTGGCRFTSYMPGESLVHGDACPPNIIGRADGTVIGYIDLGEMGAGDIEVDPSGCTPRRPGMSLRPGDGAGGTPASRIASHH